MNEQLLTNIWDIFSADGLTENDYEVWKSNFSKSEEFQKNGYEYLQSKGYTSPSESELDIGGLDSAHKLTILSSLCFGDCIPKEIKPSRFRIFRENVSLTIPF